MSILSTHPNKLEIDALIKSNKFSYRELETEFAAKFGLRISYKSIQTYHTKELGGTIDTDNSQSDATGFELDNEKLEQTVRELLQEIGSSILKRQTARLFAIQMQITENALLQHSQGIARYPSEYVRNLQIFSNILMKKT